MKKDSIIVKLLGGLLDQFKAKHAGVYFVLVIIFGALAAVANYFQGDIGLTLPHWVDVVTQVIFYGYTILGGAHTPEKSE